MNLQIIRDHLTNFQFQELFVEGLGWERPLSGPSSMTFKINSDPIPYSCIAEISGVPVLKFNQKAFNKFQSNAERKKFHKRIKDKIGHRHLVLFSDDHTFFEISYLSKAEQIRKNPYFKGQSGDYFISKLASIHFGIEDEPTITDIGKKLEKAFDTEKVTKKFYQDFKNNHFHFQKYITGIKTEEEKKWYASIILNRLMFIWFLQKKNFVNHDFDYLQTKLDESKQRGKDKYYSEFLTCLFFEGFAKKPKERSTKAKNMLGKIKYLNGGLFVPHTLEEKYAIKGKNGEYKTNIKISDKAFEETFSIFSQYDWHLQGKQEKPDNEISPDVMGYIFEKYINELQQKSLGAYYTRDEITSYLSRNTIQKSILEKINKQGYEFENIADMLHKLNPDLCKKLLTNKDSILNTLTVLDPAVGSGAFLVSAMKELVDIYSPIIGKIKTLNHRGLNKWLSDFENQHKSFAYGIKKNIILKNLYGVDIMKEAVEVCKLRLFLSLVSSALDTSELEPLPNMDFNILCGNSLIGFLRESEKETAEDTQIVWSGILGESYQQIKDRYNQMVDRYKNQALSFERLKELKSKITQFLKENSQKLNLALADKCQKAGVKYHEILDIQGKKKITEKRSVRSEDFYSKEGERNLNPFHWDLAFNEIMASGGFDCILTNPPWDKVKTEDREFFRKYDLSIEKKKGSKALMRSKKEALLQNPKIKKDCFETQEFYRFQRDYFSGLYNYQTGLISNTDGTEKKASSDMETYRLFTERCFELLDNKGFLGAVLPSALLKDDGAIGLRKNLLFNKTKINSLIDFQNQMETGQGTIFEGVASKQTFLILNLQKTKPKDEFPCRFYTRNLKVLENFPPKREHGQLLENGNPPNKEALVHKALDNKKEATNIIDGRSAVIWQSIKEIKQLSPRDHAIIEFKNPRDRAILKKVSRFQIIGEKIASTWNPIFYTEFHETNDALLFKNKKPAKGEKISKNKSSAESKKSSDTYLPLYKGSAIYQYEFNHALHHVNRYVSTKAKKVKQGKGLAFRNQCYKSHRLVLRTIASNTNERSLISAVIPKNHFISHSLHGVHIESPNTIFSTKKGGLSNMKTGWQIHLDSRETPCVLRGNDGLRGKEGLRRNDGLHGNDRLCRNDGLRENEELSENKRGPKAKSSHSNNRYMLLLQSFFNSFVVDYFIRQKVFFNIDKKYITSLHIPRLTEKDPYFKELVKRSAKLTCIGKEFDDLADEIGIPRGGVKDQQHRWHIQGEIDAIVAYIYGLTLEEFEYVLSTFTTGKNQIRLNTLKNYAREAFKKDKFLNKAS